jgi:hypothetical protein
MRRSLLIATMLIAMSVLACGQTVASFYRSPTNSDEEELKKVVQIFGGTCMTGGDIVNLEKVWADTFRCSVEGIAFNKKIILEAIRSGEMKVAGWTIDDLKVSVRGNAASVTGRTTLPKATYMDKDFSGEYVWTDRFVKQRDGSWLVLSSQSRRIRQ